MSRLLHIIEKIIVVALIVMMIVILLLATADLGWLILEDILSPPVFLLEIEELLDVFSFFLLVLIGVELLDTIRAYFDERIVHVEIVLEVAMIAVARKVITLNMKEVEGLTLIGMAAIIVTLAVAFFFIRTRQNAVHDRHR